MPVLRKFIQESKCDDEKFSRLCFYYDLLGSQYTHFEHLNKDLSNCEDSDKKNELYEQLKEAEGRIDRYAAIIAIESQL